MLVVNKTQQWQHTDCLAIHQLQEIKEIISMRHTMPQIWLQTVFAIEKHHCITLLNEVPHVINMEFGVVL